MTSRNGHSKVGIALVIISMGLFVLPALFPVQPVFVHDTGPITFDGPEEFEKEGIEVVSYENLSERGQELYVQTLKSGGEYQVSLGKGASDFEYLTSTERSTAQKMNPNERPGMIIVERSTATDLPPADEPDIGAREGDVEEDERRQHVQRYDMMSTATEPPSLGSATQLLRLGAAILAVVSLCLGGYLLSRN